MAGQIVAEGFIQWKLRPWLRRIITRSLAIVPALIVALVVGDDGINKLLIVSQVILSMQLPFAVFPLVYFTSQRDLMGSFVNGKVVMVVGYFITTVLVGLNIFLLVKVFGG
jgi:manganese transport protein